MKCAICRHGETHLGATTVTLERNNVTIIFKSVPARVCDNCGEDYAEEDTGAQLLALLDEAERAGVVLDVRDLAAAAPLVS